MAAPRQSTPLPVFRKLRIFAVDPGMTARFETAVMNEMTASIPWEPLDPGPIGEYIAVVDENAEGARLNEPVDLERTELLAQNGLPPSDGNPQFRQQMVYAVAMRTIRNFERALGRVVHWEPLDGSYRRRLNLYPHFEVIETAHYDPSRGIRFGYFESVPESPFPGTVVFTCLSGDVIAHELTHALLIGMNIDFELGENKDVAALHEGFADLIALFQHFSESDVLRAHMAAVRGNLEERSQLGAVALQMGQALGLKDGVRNALGHTDDKGIVESAETRRVPLRQLAGGRSPRPWEPARRRRLRGVQKDLRVARDRPAADRDARHRRLAAGLPPSRSDRALHAGGVEVRAPRARDVHACARLHAAGRGDVRRLPPRRHHRGLRPRPQ